VPDVLPGTREDPLALVRDEAGVGVRPPRQRFCHEQSLRPANPRRRWFRAFDPDDNAGVWNYGSFFTKTFDKTAPAGPVTGTAIKNLHMRDNITDDTLTADADHDLSNDYLSNGYQTTVPLVT
jgi:hypothetical protein